jgi:hypothetical protein
VHVGVQNGTTFFVENQIVESQTYFMVHA